MQADAAVGDSPLWFGEWALPTQFRATDEFLYKWADAQKFAYGKDKGWIVCRVYSFISRKIDTHILSSSGTSRSRYPNAQVTLPDNGTYLPCPAPAVLAYLG